MPGRPAAPGGWLSRRPRRGGLFVNLLVLAETVWTLRRSYRYSRAHLLDVVSDLAGTSGVTLADHAAVTEALTICNTSPADFPDALIARSTRARAVRRPTPSTAMRLPCRATPLFRTCECSGCHQQP